MRPGTVTRPARRTAWRWALLLFIGWLCQAALRVWLSRMQVVPLADPDEPAYLIAARVLAGGLPANLSGDTLYRAGYPLLITPVYWFTSDPATVYRAVMVINALVSAALMPLAYLACRRLGLARAVALGVSAVAALVPAAVFYSQYALADAIYPVIYAGWLLAVHSWLTAPSRRTRYAAAAGSAVLTGYAYAVHSRGDVLLAAYGAVLVLIAVRRLAPRRTLAAACPALLAALAAAFLLDRRISAASYPEGARDLFGELLTRVTSVQGQEQTVVLAAGEVWRLTLNTWGIAAIGLLAAGTAICSRRVRWDLRVMAVIMVAISVAVAYAAPAALPSGQTMAWASGRYLDGDMVVYFLAGVVVLLNGSQSLILRYGAGAAVTMAVPALLIAFGYAHGQFAIDGFQAFNFGEPAVLIQNWTYMNVLAATAIALELLALWVVVALALHARGPAFVKGGVLLAAIAAVNLFAVQQMTTHISQAAIPSARTYSAGFVTASGLKPGEQVAIDTSIASEWWLQPTQAYEVWWTQLQVFNPATSAPPRGVTVAELAWPAGQPASASWPDAPAGWHIVASSSTAGWVAWRSSVK